MSILQTILQDQQTPECPLLITPAEKLLWDGISQKDIEKVEQSIQLNGGVPSLPYDLLWACATFFDPQICERLFPQNQVHPLGQSEVLFLLESLETARAFLPSLVEASNKLIDEKEYYNNSKFGMVLYCSGENLALVLQDPQCNVLQRLQKCGEEKNFVKWVIQSCQPALLEAANADVSQYSTDLKYTLPGFKTLKEVSNCQQVWEQQTSEHQEMLEKLLSPMHDLFPRSFGGDPWLTAYVLHNVKLMAELLSSVEGCKYFKKMLEVSQQLGCREKLMDTLLETFRFETDLEKKMDFDEYAQLFKISAQCNGSKGESFAVKMLLNVYAFHENLVTEDRYQSDNHDDDDEEEAERKMGAYEDDVFFRLLRVAVYCCEDEIVKIMDRYSKSWKPAAQKMIYEKHVGGLGCEAAKKKM